MNLCKGAKKCTVACFPTKNLVPEQTSLNDLNSEFFEDFPFIELAMIDFASDFELPGLPTRNKGIRKSIHTAIINTFSFSAEFLAMFFPSSILSSRTS